MTRKHEESTKKIYLLFLIYSAILEFQSENIYIYMEIPTLLVYITMSHCIFHLCLELIIIINVTTHTLYYNNDSTRIGICLLDSWQMIWCIYFIVYYIARFEY